MNYNSLIDQCTNYIKSNLSSEITAQELADQCGYSLYHLSSLFRACFGCSMGRYIHEEKLRLAAARIRQGHRISDVAMDVGFDTGSGFTKAFRRQFGCSPREYRDLLVSPEDTSSTASLRSAFRNPVPPEFVKRSGLKVFGYMIPVEEGHEQAGKAAFWSQVNFRAFPSYPRDASDYAEIGTWINPDVRTGLMDYFFGYITSDPRPAEGFQQLTLAGGDYAVFRLPYVDLSSTGQDNQPLLPERIQGLWQYIFEDWFSSQQAVLFDEDRLCFEKYGRDYVEICVPVKG